MAEFASVRGGSSSTADDAPADYEKLLRQALNMRKLRDADREVAVSRSSDTKPSSPLEGVTLSSILSRGGETLGKFAREVPNEIAANYADTVETARKNPLAFGPAAGPLVLSNILRGYGQGKEREERGDETSLTETPFGTHTSGDPAVKGAAMLLDPQNWTGAGLGAKLAAGAGKLLGGAAGKNLALTVFHGSPHKFAPTPDNPLGKFDMSKIGTGEGAQAYGHGLYFAENPGVAKEYAKTLGDPKVQYIGRQRDAMAQLQQTGVDPGTADMLLTWAYEGGFKGGSPAAAKSFLKSMVTPDDPPHIRAALDNPKAMQIVADYAKPVSQNLYKVDLPDEQIAKMIDWDKPLSQQPEHVRKGLEQSGLAFEAKPSVRVEPRGDRFQIVVDDVVKGTFGSQAEAQAAADAVTPTWYTAGRTSKPATGGDLYQWLVGNKKNFDKPGWQSQASEASSELRRQGIPGIRYLDQGSRMLGDADKIIANYGSREKALEVAKQRLNAASVVDRDYWQKITRELEKPQSSNFVVFDDQIPKILSRE